MKNILLISSGFTPQVITETIYFYKVVHKQAFVFDEVHVITDLRGFKKIKQNLFGADGALYKLYQDYNIDAKSIKLDESCIHIIKNKEDKMLDDIRSKSDNESTISMVFKLVQKFTSMENTILYTSVAGGRKTMSVIVGQASVFGRDHDRLIHVLVDDILFHTTARDFYYPTPYKKELLIEGEKIDISKIDVNVHEIPYVRLRSIVGDILLQAKKRSLLDIVEVAQQRIDHTFGKVQLKVDFKKKLLMVNKYPVPLPAKNLALHATLLSQTKGENFLTLDEILSIGFLEKYLGNYKKIKGQKNTLYIREKTRIDQLSNIDDFYSKEWFMESISKIRRDLKNTLPEHLSSKVIIQNIGKYGESRYGISPDLMG